MDVLIVGAGAAGRWVARAVDARVAFADVDDEAARSAAESVGGEVAPLVPSTDGPTEKTGQPASDEPVTNVDAVCIAVPMQYAESAIEIHASRAEEAVLDVTGSMTGPVGAMRAHAPDRERVSLHALFAPDRAPGSIAVVRDAAGPVTDALLADLAERGNDLVETTATAHDEAMETVQAATHAAVLSFALAATSVPEGLETPVYADLREVVERVTDGTPRVYADIQRTFDGADAVAEAAERVATAEGDDLEALHRAAASAWADVDPSRAETTRDDAEHGGDGA